MNLKPGTLSKWIGLAIIFALSGNSFAASLFVYGLDIDAFNQNRYSYSTQAPHLTWSVPTIQSNPSGWHGAKQFLVFQTDQLYKRGTWAIQVYTDNAHLRTAQTFHLPDYFDAAGNPFQPTTSGAQSPLYEGGQTITVSGDIQYPKGGLVSSDGAERLPLIWRIFNTPPGANRLIQLPPIVENALGASCNFADCAWFFTSDRGDERQVGGNRAPLFQDNFWYNVPLNQDGGQYNVCPPGTPANICQRGRPLGDFCLCNDCGRCGYCNQGERNCAQCNPTQPGCTTTQYMFLGSNFKNATTQKYRTTFFVELVLP